jgi:hypothetical protein
VVVTQSAVALITTFNAQTAELEAALSGALEATVMFSLPELRTVLAARI